MGKTLIAQPGATADGLNVARYRQLCGEILPRMITNDEELDRMAEHLERLTFKQHASAEELAMADLLQNLIQAYDDKIELPDILPHQMIAHLMKHRGLRQADLLPVFGSRSVASSVLAGKREPSKAHIRKLAEFFHISPEVFL